MTVIAKARRGVLPESRILALFCLVDLVLTLWIVESGLGVEANPIMRFYYDISPLAFALAKTFLCLAPILFLEQLYDRNPRFIRGVLRAGTAAYASIYLIGMAAVNQFILK